jgi:hypothetical protein
LPTGKHLVFGNKRGELLWPRFELQPVAPWQGRIEATDTALAAETHTSRVLSAHMYNAVLLLFVIARATSRFVFAVFIY